MPFSSRPHWAATNVKGIQTCEISHQGLAYRRSPVLTAVGGAMLLGSIAGANSASASSAPASAASASAAAPAPNASAISDAQGMRVTGLGGPNKVTVRAVSGQNLFLVTDTAPISADTGCAAVPVQAGLFGVQCRALPGSGGTQFRSFSVNGGGGDDTITNFAPAAMRADGGAGNDILNGGSFGDILRDSAGSDTLRGNGGQDDLQTESTAAGGGADVLDGGPELDILQAGPGSDTLIGGTGNARLVGGLGADKMNASSGTGDVVAYEGRTARVVVILDDQPNDGEAGEGDKITNAEIIQGGRGPDTMIGDDKANIFEGFDGDDVLIGGRGADDLRGGTGNDRLASNDLFGVPVQDGSIDRLDGFDGTDYSRVPFVEPDITVGCEIIDKD